MLRIALALAFGAPVVTACAGHAPLPARVSQVVAQADEPPAMVVIPPTYSPVISTTRFLASGVYFTVDGTIERDPRDTDTGTACPCDLHYACTPAGTCAADPADPYWR